MWELNLFRWKIIRLFIDFFPISANKWSSTMQNSLGCSVATVPKWPIMLLLRTTFLGFSLEDLLLFFFEPIWIDSQFLFCINVIQNVWYTLIFFIFFQYFLAPIWAFAKLFEIFFYGQMIMQYIGDIILICLNITCFISSSTPIIICTEFWCIFHHSLQPGREKFFWGYSIHTALICLALSCFRFASEREQMLICSWLVLNQLHPSERITFDPYVLLIICSSWCTTLYIIWRLARLIFRESS